MDNRGQVSSPLFWRLWLIAYIGLGVYLLASIVMPSLRQAADDMYWTAWGIFLAPIVVALLARWRHTEHEDPQKRLSDYEESN